MRVAGLLFALLTMAACATDNRSVSGEGLFNEPQLRSPSSDPGPSKNAATPEETKLALAPAPSAPTGPFNAKQYAAAFPRPTECEPAARQLQAKSADMAWAVLKECVEHGNFTTIKRLTDGAWDKDLQSRPDASVLIAKVIAARGGDIDGDLGALRQRKVPVFSLGSAMEEPGVYKGRLVLIRGRVEERKTEKGKPSVLFAEMGLGTKSQYLGKATVWSGSYGERGSGSVSHSYSDGRHTGSSGSYNTGGEWEAKRTTRDEYRHDNRATETGRTFVARLPKSDPFLEPGKEFVVLARFEGVRTSSEAETDEEEEASKFAVISVVQYFEPQALLIE